MLKVDKKDCNEIDIYYIAYVTGKKIDTCNNINSVNSLYLMIEEMIGRFEEKNQINLKDFDARLLKVDKKVYIEIDVYYIGYVTVKNIANFNNINSVFYQSLSTILCT